MTGVRTIGLLSALAVAAACGSSTGPAASDLVGTWHATRMQYVSTTGLGTVDIVAAGGTVTLVLNADSTYQLTVTPSGGSADVSAGTWSNSIDVMTVRETGMTGEMQFQMTYTATTLTLTGANTSYDFNGDGTEEAATLNVTFTR